MTRDHFAFRKENQLKKIDKSFKGNWDSKIISLCEKINSKKEYYTTSSCSGRVILLKQEKRKSKDLFVKVWHDLIFFNELKKTLSEVKLNEIIYFKLDSAIIHVSCKNIEDAKKLIEIANSKAGWKRCSIISFGKRIIVELNSTERIEFPLFKDKILVDDNFLKLVIEDSNKKLKQGWDKINRLEKLI